MFKFLNKLGEWNPQLMREIKGRFKLFPVLVTAGISGLVQVVVCLFQLREYPDAKYAMSGSYCTLGNSYQEKIGALHNVINKFQAQVNLFNSKATFNAEKLKSTKLQLQAAQTQQAKLSRALYDSNNFCPSDQINMQSWWQDHWQYIFLSFSIIFIFTLLVAGTYLLINNLAHEERTGTLNFIRLSPQSETSILTGKILGVPILAYWFVTLAIPLHIWSGKAANANITFSHLFSYYTILAGSCIFFFSAALLFTLATRFLGGFQPWLAAGAVFIFLIFTFSMGYSGTYINNGAAWFHIFSPMQMIRDLFPHLFTSNSSWRLEDYNNYSFGRPIYLQFFFLPIQTNVLGLMGLYLANYTIWTYGICQGLQRRFRNPNTPVISKIQSYWLVGFIQFLLWGFTFQNYQVDYKNNFGDLSKLGQFDVNLQISQNLPWFIIFNMLLLFGLMLILSPERQTIQDWSRYRHQGGSGRKGWWRNSLLGDLLIGEKSPSLVAIAVHLVMIVTPLAIWIILAISPHNQRSTSINWLIKDIAGFKVVIGMVMFITLSLIYATIVQRMLLMKTKKRYFWAVGTVSAIMYVPPIVFAILNMTPKEYALPWLLSSFPWAGFADASLPTIFMALLGEIALLVVLNIRLTKQINLAVESATKALLVGSRE
jgi:hypothetical protein